MIFCCWRTATASGARGTGTPTPASGSTSPRSATSSPSPPARAGRASTRPGASSRPTRRIASASTACVRASASTLASPRRPSTTRVTSGGCAPPAATSCRAPARWLLSHLPGGKLAARAAGHAFVELTFPLAAHFHGTVPIAAVGERIGHRHLRRQVEDPVIREQLTPRYALGCKRPSFSNEYLATFNRPDVRLETSPIAAVTAAGVRTADGTEHPIDVLVLATGFKVFESGNMPPFEIRGRDGLDLEAWWDEHRYQAYEGVSVPSFPNLFTILGPCAGANSYYFDRHGDVPFRPASTPETTWRSARFDLDDYRYTTAPHRASAGRRTASHVAV